MKKEIFKDITEKFSKNLKHLANAFRYSLCGLKTCFKNETAFRQEVILGVLNAIMLFILPLSFATRLSMIAIWLLLLSVELLNSAIEAVVNLVSPDYHILAKQAKDYGSAAVFCILVLFWGGWIIIVSNLLFS